ncbi:periplasmic chaperone for outer membrane proteins Skp [Muriicola jejuensis]|uniref:OmpH family outer membrane protein n=1 Tax=Muriicola jejuensis TaxID=504488 RepID=A0A6P0UH22_9FLAO|nr:OmpH family outer membrane protein [Muriicola jejuensis]NER09416.1 OmpH family outer membrane protein [Muriicola jejuensis]SMP08778.1 periplasmic chaperone for outer membrane proteins Skp [Muriicola jejuensis]
MKTNVLLIMVVFLAASSTFAQRGVRIGYVDMEYILENVEEYREANEQLENRVQRWKLEIEEKQAVIDQMKKDLMAEKVLLTNELIAERTEEIQILEKEMLEYQQNRFGPNGDLVLQKQRLIQPIQDQVFNEVQAIGANKKYDFIFDKSADVVMLYSEKRHDISELVLRGIARTRRVSKPNKADEKARLAAFEAEAEEEEEELTDALRERLEKAQEADSLRRQTADEKRAEQLKLREERKKAYEERRKKLLEEREAKRKEKEEERVKQTEQKKDTVNQN